MILAYSPVIRITADEAEALADALEALQRLVETDPVEESIRDLIYRCQYCGEHGGHESDCPWRLGRAALDRLAGREAG